MSNVVLVNTILFPVKLHEQRILHCAPPETGDVHFYGRWATVRC